MKDINEISIDDIKEYIEASTKAMAACLDSITTLNAKIIELNKKLDQLERVVGSVAVRN